MDKVSFWSQQNSEVGIIDNAFLDMVDELTCVYICMNILCCINLTGHVLHISVACCDTHCPKLTVGIADEKSLL